MRHRGIKASQLIKKLQQLVKSHGDQEVIAGGDEYPRGVIGARLQTEDRNPYVPKGTFYIV
jgi:hypothetical protein